jgi:hypothetical protein
VSHTGHHRGLDRHVADSVVLLLPALVAADRHLPVHQRPVDHHRPVLAVVGEPQLLVVGSAAGTPICLPLV